MWYRPSGMKAAAHPPAAGLPDGASKGRGGIPAGSRSPSAGRGMRGAGDPAAHPPRRPEHAGYRIRKSVGAWDPYGNTLSPTSTVHLKDRPPHASISPPASFRNSHEGLAGPYSLQGRRGLLSTPQAERGEERRPGGASRPRRDGRPSRGGPTPPGPPFAGYSAAISSGWDAI